MIMIKQETTITYTSEQVQKILQKLLIDIESNHYNNATNIAEMSHNNAIKDAGDEVRKVLYSLQKEELDR